MGVRDLAPFMGVMLITGTANTILMKFMCTKQVPTGPHQPATGFDHPFFQTVLMMIGELLCLGVFYLSRSAPAKQAKEDKSVPAWVFLVPCACDWSATTLVNASYMFLAASVVQMTRGAIVIFTCAFSMIFLGRRQEKYHFVGVGLVFLGLTVVSLSALHKGGPVVLGSNSNVLLGLAFTIGAQIFQASMLVYEEKVMKNADYHVEPMQMVGMEGFWGCIIGVVLLAGLNYTGIEDSRGAFYQMTNSMPLAVACIGSIFSIAFFNWSGVTVTQKASATARSTIDSSRTILIWVVELALQWNKFNPEQMLGFVFLAAGTMIYNQIIVLPGMKDKEKQALMSP